MNRRHIILVALLALTTLAAVIAIKPRIGIALFQRVKGRKTVTQRLEEFGPDARQRLETSFRKAQVTYPPRKVILLFIKQERRLELLASGPEGPPRFIRAWLVKAASGTYGPKLREGDNQVPEGIYEIESLNPNSLFHVAARLNYPNAYDRQQAARDGRSNLGGDIMIHGRAASIGCLAMGDEAAEEIFTLIADASRDSVRVILAPVDFRRESAYPPATHLPAWVKELYEEIRSAMSSLPSAPPAQ